MRFEPAGQTRTRAPSTWEERRARRALRRERERARNVGRAAAMHVQRVVRERAARRGATEPAAPPITLPRVLVGCSGWFYWHWRGGFYPAELPTRGWFLHYADRFDTVELNAPFYSWPTVRTVETWARQPGRRRFVYTVKASELITHVKRFAGTKTLVRDFGYVADVLGRRMGCLLFQLPPSFQYTRARLDRILAQLDPARRNVVEFRHPSWWNDTVFSAFAAHRTVFCSCSAPRLPDGLVKTTDEIYVRFHGVRRWYRHDYSRDELAVWARAIRASGATRVWAYFNNDRNRFAIKNARTFRRLLVG